MTRGRLPSGWGLAKIGDVARIDFSGVDKKTRPGERSVRLCNYVNVFHNSIITESLPFQEATATPLEISRFQLRKDDVLFTKDSETPEEIAEPAYVADDLPGVICGYHLGIARPKQGFDGRFLYFAMKNPTVRSQFAKVANGVTRFGLTLEATNSVHIAVPPLNEQQCIADILTTWGQAIVAAERIRYCVGRLYLSVADQTIHLRGANVRPLGDVLTQDHMQTVEARGPFRALGVRSHGKGTFQRIDDLDALGSDKTLYRVEAGRLIVNIVFAWEGAAAITSVEDSECFVSHRFPTFTIKEELLSPEYFGHVIRTKYFCQLLALASPGGAGRNKTLNRRDLLRFEMHVPPLPEQRRVAQALSMLDRRFKLFERYEQSLIAQRDALASELLTGRLRVRDAERLGVAAAG